MSQHVVQCSQLHRVLSFVFQFELLLSYTDFCLLILVEDVVAANTRSQTKARMYAESTATGGTSDAVPAGKSDLIHVHPLYSLVHKELY